MNIKPKKEDYYSEEEYSEHIDISKFLNRSKNIFLAFFSILSALIIFRYYFLYPELGELYFLAYLIMFIIGHFLSESAILLLFKRRAKRINKLEKIINNYNNDLYSFFSGHIELNILTLDEIRSKYLYYKRINSFNYSHWINYKNIINEVPENLYYFLKVEPSKFQRFKEHRRYMTNKNEGTYRPITSVDYDDNSMDHIKDHSSLIGNQYEPRNPHSDSGKLSVNQLINKIKNKINDNDYNYQLMQQIGELGELLVFQDQETQLKERSGCNDDYPIHVSKEHGDEFGFDIISLNNKKKRIFIEAKSTVKSLDSSFILTVNELNTFEKYQDHYLIARVTNCNLEKNSGDIQYYDYNSIKGGFEKKANTYKFIYKNQ